MEDLSKQVLIPVELKNKLSFLNYYSQCHNIHVLYIYFSLLKLLEYTVFFSF